MSLSVTSVRLRRGSWRNARGGLLGYIQFTVDGCLRVDGVTLRRTQDGSLTLSFPRKQGREGTEYFYLRPLDDRTRREVERQVLDQLGEVAP